MTPVATIPDENTVYDEYIDREATVSPSVGGFSYNSDETEVIDVLSDSDSDSDEDRKPSPAPTESSVQLLAAVNVRNPGLSAFALPEEKKTDEKKAPSPRRPRAPRQPMTEIEQGQLISLRENGWTIAKIAEHLGRTEASVKWYIHRRKAKINQFMATLPKPVPSSAALTRPGNTKTEEDVKPIPARANGRRMTAKRERDIEPAFGPGAVDVKPLKRAKKEEPF